MRKNRTREIIKLIKLTYTTKGDVRQKIALLINTRRVEKSNLIQKACNKYLDLLYNQKYELLKRGA